MTDVIKLPTGREFYANCGIVGIDDTLDVFGGYDGDVNGAGLDDDGWRPEAAWSVDDRVALADMMIDRWQRYKDAALSRPTPEKE